MPQITTKVIGLDELLRTLMELRDDITGNPVKNALRAAGRDVKKRMIREAPEDTGRLKRSIIGPFVERHPHTLNEIVYVGPKAGKNRDDESGAWYAAIVEFQGGKDGRGKGFMRRSIDRSEDVKTITKKLAADVEKIARKAGNENAQRVAANVKAQANQPASGLQGLMNWRPRV